MNHRQDKLQIHSITAELSKGLVGKGSRMTLDPKVERSVMKKLDAMYGTLEVAHAARSILALAAHIELAHGAVDVANQLLAIAASTAGDLQGQADKIETKKSENVQAKTRRFRNFTGAAAPVRAPRFGGAMAAGSFRASTFRIPAVFR